MAAKLHGAIAAGNPSTAEAGLEMLRQGGNIFDAVVAAVLAACVVEPTLTSLGGGGFLLAHTANQQNILFDFFTQTPRQRRSPDQVSFYPVEVDFGITTQEFHIGLGSVAVPGTVKGMTQVHQQLGRLPFALVAEPAIQLAKTGFTVGTFQAYCFRILEPILLACPEMRQIVAPHGRLLQPGDWLRMPALADTLMQFVEEGDRLFYVGELAQQLVRDSQAQGGYLTLDDLAHYQVIERSPLLTNYRGHTLVTNPPPSSGGTLIAFALKLLSGIDLSSVTFGSTTHLTLLAEVMRQTNLARADGYDARLYQPGVAEHFLADTHCQPYADPLKAIANKWGSTTHISGIDSDGNAASVTTSNGEGSAYTIPGTGVMMNNMLGEADLHPSGFSAWTENVRISSMMAPTLVLRHGKPELVLGSGGSNRIRTAILQVISNLIDFHMPVRDAVASPRVHWENGVFNLEPGLSLPPLEQAEFPFDQQWMAWEQQNMFFGGVHAVQQTEPGVFTGAGDLRRNGAIAVLDP
ncbi:MAG: gamma-glutamyltransferase [Kaiparowitsia implicata GSE-PSE-MK54-09C]|jgi:gamma-glutamyltranspeptidase/glutathione hydrolase|nr:gamma-glutamyltransferase [Kaiparowitsia implicata GSE-PSE-MK54-09C]